MTHLPVQRYIDGLLVYEPLYGFVERVAELLSKYEALPVSIKIEDAALMAVKDLFGEVTLNISDRLGVALSLTGLTYLIMKKMAGRLYRGVRQRVGPMSMDIATFPDAPTNNEDGVVGQVVSAEIPE